MRSKRRRLESYLVTTTFIACAAGCAAILGREEITIDPSAEDASKDGAETSEANDSSTDAASTMDAGDAADAIAVDAPPDGPCNQKIVVDFTAALPPEATEQKDALGSSIAYELVGPQSSRAMRVLVPSSATNAGLVIDIEKLAKDGTTSCNVECAAQIKLVQRAGTTELTELAMQEAAGSGPFAAIRSSDTFTYFSRSGMGLEAPDLGSLSAATFTQIAIEVRGTAAPFAGIGRVGTASNQKAITFFPTSVRVGLERQAGSGAIEAVFDDIVCRSILP